MLKCENLPRTNSTKYFSQISAKRAHPWFMSVRILSTYNCLKHAYLKDQKSVLMEQVAILRIVRGGGVISVKWDPVQLSLHRGSLWVGVSVCRGDVSVQCVSLSRGISVQGSLSGGGGDLCSGSICDRDLHSFGCGQTDTFENITFLQLRLRADISTMLPINSSRSKWYIHMASCHMPLITGLLLFQECQY